MRPGGAPRTTPTRRPGPPPRVSGLAAPPAPPGRAGAPPGGEPGTKRGPACPGGASGVPLEMITGNEADAVLPWASVAVQVTVHAPTGNAVPARTTALVVVPFFAVQLGVRGPSTRSEATTKLGAVNTTVDVVADGEVIVCAIGPETSKTGGVVSLT